MQENFIVLFGSALADLDMEFKTSVVKISGSLDPITLKRISAFPMTLNGISTDCTVDTGCTAEAIVSQSFAERANLKIKPTHIKKARLADGNQQMDILGSTNLKKEFMGNKLTCEALVSNGWDKVS